MKYHEGESAGAIHEDRKSKEKILLWSPSYLFGDKRGREEFYIVHV